MFFNYNVLWCLVKLKEKKRNKREWYEKIIIMKTSS